MLNVFVYGEGQRSEEVIPKGLKYCRDVEATFPFVDFEANEVNSNIVNEIDEGTLIDRLHFKSRYGATLNIEFLSTGAKAALLVHNSDYVVDTLECGHNALCMIFSCCTGSIVMRRNLNGYMETLYEVDRPITVNGVRFITIEDAWRYMENVAHYTP